MGEWGESGSWSLSRDSWGAHGCGEPIPAGAWLLRGAQGGAYWEMLSGVMHAEHKWPWREPRPPLPLAVSRRGGDAADRPNAVGGSRAATRQRITKTCAVPPCHAVPHPHSNLTPVSTPELRPSRELATLCMSCSHATSSHAQLHAPMSPELVKGSLGWRLGCDPCSRCWLSCLCAPLPCAPL